MICLNKPNAYVQILVEQCFGQAKEFRPGDYFGMFALGEVIFDHKVRISPLLNMIDSCQICTLQADLRDSKEKIARVKKLFKVKVRICGKPICLSLEDYAFLCRIILPLAHDFFTSFKPEELKPYESRGIFRHKYFSFSPAEINLLETKFGCHF